MKIFVSFPVLQAGAKNVTVIRRATLDDAEAIARIHLISWRQSIAVILTSEQVGLKNLDQDHQHKLWERRLDVEENQSRYTVVAENEAGEVIGYATGRDNHTAIRDYDAELHQIYILPDSQGHGIGKQLVQALTRELYKAGYQSLIVWVIPDNPAVRFYRDGLGGQYLDERIIPDGDGILKEDAYGWPDITVLYEIESWLFAKPNPAMRLALRECMCKAGRKPIVVFCPMTRWIR